ncbi:MAG: serine hydrolase domain-containing protein [Pseudomonadota bacterium]
MSSQALLDAGLPWAMLNDGSGHGWQRTGPRSQTIRLSMHVRIGSVSKLFVGAIAARLAEQGRINPDNPISDLLNLPNLPSDVTLIDCLAHRTGLRDALEDPAFRNVVNADVTAAVPVEDVVSASLSRPRDGSRAGYANINAILITLAIAKETGRAFDDHVMDVFGRTLGLGGGLPRPHPEGWRYGQSPQHVEYGAQLYPATHFNPSWAGAAGAMHARLCNLPRLLCKAFHILRSAPEIDPSYHWLAKRSADGLWHDGDVPGFSAWAAQRGARVSVTVAGLSWVPGLGNPAALLGQNMHFEEDWP